MAEMHLFPYSDWQFWVATAIVVLIVGRTAGSILALPGFAKARKARKGRKKATLTIGGKPMRK